MLTRHNGIYKNIEKLKLEENVQIRGRLTLKNVHYLDLKYIQFYTRSFEIYTDKVVVDL